MSSWYTAPELAKLDLPGLPATKQNMIARARSEQWVSQPRRARGGGKEYHVSSLPEVARIALARRAVDPDAPYEPREGDPSFTPCTRGSRNRGQARLYVVNMFLVFAAAASLQGGYARAGFCHLYNNPTGEHDLHIPEWVRDYIYRTNVRTLEGWVRKAKREGIEALAGNYGHRRGKGTIDSQPAIRDFCATQIETRSQLTANQLVRGIEAQFGEKLSKRTVQRWMQSFKEANAARLLSLHDPDKHKSKFQSAFGSSSESVVAPNQVWEIDATPADVMTLEADGSRRRMNITGIIDVYTRRAHVVVTDTPKAIAATAVTRKAIIDWGVPDLIKTDNGKDFVSAHFKRALHDLNIKQKLCPPFTPEGKPHIERFFGTMARDLLSILPGFVGHNVSDRKSIEARRSFAQRFGSPDEVIDVQMSAEQLQSVCDIWLETNYERQEHNGLQGKTPFEVAYLWKGGIRTIPNDRILDLMLMEAPDKDGFRVIGKKGIRVERTAFIAPELGPRVGEKVHVRIDPCDMGHIHVYTPDGEFICVAEAPERTGADRQKIAIEARRLQKQMMSNARADAKRRARQFKPHLLADQLLDQAARASNTVVAFPNASTPHETDATRAAEDNLRAINGENQRRDLTPEEEEMAERAFAELEETSPPASTVVKPKNTPWSDDPPPEGHGYEWVIWARRHRHQLSEDDAALLELREADPELMIMVKAMSD